MTNLVERYIYEVTRHLPNSQREDVSKELQGTIEDMSEHLAKGKKASLKIIEEVLTELGDPHLLAQQYSDQKQYLIGPMWFEIYIETLKKILIPVLPIVAIVMIFLKFMSNSAEANLIQILLQSFGHSINVGIQILFWTTLVFFVLERSDADPKEMIEKKAKAWSVDRLPVLPKTKQIKTGESITAIFFIIMGMFFVVFSDSVMTIKIDGQSTPILNPELWNLWLPLFFGLSFLTLLHEGLKLRIGNWTTLLTISNIILSLIGIAYLLLLFGSENIINPDFAAFMAEKMDGKHNEIGRWTIGITILITCIVYVWEIVKSIGLNREYRKYHDDMS